MVFPAAALFRAWVPLVAGTGRIGRHGSVPGNVRGDGGPAAAPASQPIIVPPDPVGEIPRLRVVEDNACAAEKVTQGVNVAARQVVTKVVVADLVGEPAVLVAKAVVVELHVVYFVMPEYDDAAMSLNRPQIGSVYFEIGRP